MSSLDSPSIIVCECVRAGAVERGIVNEKTVAKQEVEDIASILGINCEDFFSQARLYLGDGISDSQYSFEALGRRTNVMRVHISRS